MTMLLPAICAVLLCQPPAADQQPPSPPPTTTPHQDAALDRLTAAAEAGDHWAMFLMNCVYSAYLDEQTPVEFDLPADKRPLWDLAVQATKETGHTFDPQKYVEWTERAARAGNRRAIEDLASLYATGRHVPAKDAAKALEYLRAAIDQGSAIARYELAKAYTYATFGLPRDTAQAEPHFKAALPALEAETKAGNPRAMMALSYYYWEGVGGLPKDRRRCRSLLAEAATTGDVAAMAILGRNLYYGYDDLPADKGAGLNWIRRGAEHRGSGAMYLLGVLHIEGELPDSDPARGVELIRQSADRGSVLAMHHLAVLYDRGTRGLKRDATKAEHWMRRAADTEYWPAVYALGRWAYDGHNGPLDRRAAAGYFRAAAETGGPEAMVMLARMHRAGEGGLARDDAMAAALFREAADLGSTDAMVDLAEMHRTGAGGLPADAAQATKLLKQAADAGDERAARLLDSP